MSALHARAVFCRCPDCNSLFHVSIDPAMTPAAWVAKHAPDTKLGEVPRVRCILCWKAARASGTEGPPKGS